MGCCGGDDDARKPGVVQERKCRDVLCLLLFLAFWGGMFVICGFAARHGNTDRVMYGVDSYGFACGGSFTYKNATIDLRSRKNLYYLNPVDLLSIVNIPFAKSVCVDGCPGEVNVCDVTKLPCYSGTQFQCPYYIHADSGLYGKLSDVSVDSTTWYDKLASLPATPDGNASAIVTKLQASNIPWVTEFMSSYNIQPNGSVPGRYYQLTSQFPAQGPCFPVWASTNEYFHRCFPKVPDEWAKTVVSKVGSAVEAVGSDALGAFKDKFNDASAVWTRHVASISNGILIIIVGGLCGGVVLSLFWMIALRFAAGLMAWLTILGVNVALVGLTLYSFSFAGVLGRSEIGQAIADKMPNIMDPSAVDRKMWLYIAIAASIVTGIVLILTILCIKRIRIAVAVIKVASQAIGSMPSILLFPILPFIVEVGLVIYWVSITGLLYSAGDLTANCRDKNGTQPLTFSQLSNFTSSSSFAPSTPSTGTHKCYTNLTQEDVMSSCAVDPNCYISYDWNNAMKYAFIYHFFGLLWTNQFLIGFACVTVAGAIGSYYWTRGDSGQMPSMPVLAAMKNTIIYHLGSVAFGSFIIACIQLIRFLLEYLDRKTKELQEGNCIVKWCLCCVKCCMWCLEKIMAFINRNAYILVGIKGLGYCSAATRAISLIVSNAIRLAVVSVVGDLLLFLGKICIAATCGVIAFAMSTLPYYTDAKEHPDTFIASPILPVALSIITGYVVAEMFFSVYEMAIDTIMLSFCEDCEVNGGNPSCAPPILMDVMGQDSTNAGQQHNKPMYG